MKSERITLPGWPFFAPVSAQGLSIRFDVIFTAPAHSGGSGPDKYVLYNRRYTQNNNLANGNGGQRTEIHVYPNGSLRAQVTPNDWGL